MARLGQPVWVIVLWLSNHDGTAVQIEHIRGCASISLPSSRRAADDYSLPARGFARRRSILLIWREAGGSLPDVDPRNSLLTQWTRRPLFRACSP